MAFSKMEVSIMSLITIVKRGHAFLIFSALVSAGGTPRMFKLPLT